MIKLVYFNLGGFGDTDVTVLKHLNKEYDLTWFFLDEPLKNVNLTKEQAEQYARENNIKLHVCTRCFKQRSYKNVSFFSKIRRRMNQIDPDLIFTCISEWGWMMQVPFLKCDNIIYGIHDVKHHTYSKSFIRDLNFKIKNITKKLYKHNCVFSSNQARLYQELYGKTVANLGMSYKNFGSSNLKVADISEGVKLLFFGSIHLYKGLDLLIQNIETLYDRGCRNLTLTIAGKGPDWDLCSKYIRHKDLYNLNIRFVDNSEIPDLFSTHHLLVLPYRDATQSGPLLTALYYGLPIIAPNFGCFAETYDDKSGFLYSQGQLIEALCKASKMSASDYLELVANCRKRRQIFSEENISQNYINYFNSLL
ncbi:MULTISPECIES: glycosyltransferase family 4 protein [Segatella]|uniref:Glycosyltransferase, group 1 family n=2 Tax=Segatella TaxID=2974251 RepID=D8E0C1_9BACT|nr:MULTISPECIES: glycosyltransferase [Segatella]EFI70857.1 glycosyltransferase, group 1 family [Segatella baroniae B14]UKK79749.1 glycosyltransferase [Segatella baroniae B14]GJG28734.1 hypothetical protein PRRU23_24340 [Segatella bryantii]SEQ98838.1 Glycosyltransferase involved in cell wall bisynthesis [Segatella baroniae B14]